MSATQPVSPELVLVDPVLAAEARAQLPERPEFPPARTPAAPSPSAPPVTVSPVVVRPFQPAGWMGCRVPARQPLRVPIATRPSSRRSGRVRLAALTATVGVAIVGALALGAPSAGGPNGKATARTVAAASESGAAQTSTPTSPADASTEAAERSAAEAKVSRVFVWVAVRRAAAYEFQLFRGDALVFRTRTTRPRVTLPARWRHAARNQSLTSGTYRWYVWAVPVGRSEPVAKATVQARFVIRA